MDSYNFHVYTIKLRWLSPTVTRRANRHRERSLGKNKKEIKKF